MKYIYWALFFATSTFALQHPSWEKTEIEYQERIQKIEAPYQKQLEKKFTELEVLVTKILHDAQFIELKKREGEFLQKIGLDKTYKKIDSNNQTTILCNEINSFYQLFNPTRLVARLEQTLYEKNYNPDKKTFLTQQKIFFTDIAEELEPFQKKLNKDLNVLAQDIKNSTQSPEIRQMSQDLLSIQKEITALPCIKKFQSLKDKIVSLHFDMQVTALKDRGVQKIKMEQAYLLEKFGEHAQTEQSREKRGSTLSRLYDIEMRINGQSRDICYSLCMDAPT